MSEEHSIDILVYKLYGLTFNEVLIIDSDTTITSDEYANFSINSIQ